MQYGLWFCKMFFIEIDHGEDVNQIMTISKNNCDRKCNATEIPNFETFLFWFLPYGF